MLNFKHKLKFKLNYKELNKINKMEGKKKNNKKL